MSLLAPLCDVRPLLAGRLLVALELLRDIHVSCRCDFQHGGGISDVSVERVAFPTVRRGPHHSVPKVFSCPLRRPTHHTAFTTVNVYDNTNSASWPTVRSASAPVSVVRLRRRLSRQHRLVFQLPLRLSALHTTRLMNPSRLAYPRRSRLVDRFGMRPLFSISMV